ncbi:MAG TPA: hypothetical protein VKI18_03195 [Albitalea sp.]|nr:hypothetical protein [Albitalea sp.]
MSLPLSWRCALAALAVAACSPALNWREIHLAEGDVTALFPCRPDRFVRDIQLAGTPARMVLLSCEAAGATYGLSQVDMADPGKVHAALSELRRSAAVNVGGTAQRVAALDVPGMTPNPLAERVMIAGHGRDGAPLVEQAGFFSRGTRCFQATVFGPKLEREAVDTFFAGLKLPR